MSDDYIKSHEKLDKKYVMMPMSLKMLAPKDKHIIDVGCGDGFFAKEFAQTASFVLGIDSSEEQIKKANKSSQKNISYQLADMHTFKYPKTDGVFVPFVLNYIQQTHALELLLEKLYKALNSDGVIAGILDTPKSTYHDMRKFGSIKKLERQEEGAPMTIELYHDNMLLTELHSFYHTKDTITHLLQEVGFIDMQWHTPTISQEGITKKGTDFWQEYIDNCDVSYFSAKK